MKRAAAGLLLVIGCSKPAPASPDQVVYNELVACGALAPDPDAGVQSVAQEHAVGDMPWLECMYRGGTAAACNAPCQ